MIPQHVMDSLVTLCEATLATEQARPAVVAWTRMERHWAWAVRTGQAEEQPRQAVAAAMSTALELARSGNLPARYKPASPGTAELTAWLEDAYGGALEYLCRWVADNVDQPRQVAAAVLLVGNLAMAHAARTCDYVPTARAALEALQAGASVTVPVVRMLRELVPAGKTVPFVLPAEPYEGDVDAGDVVHVGLQAGAAGTELMPVLVTEIDEHGRGFGIVVDDPLSPATCGYRQGSAVRVSIDQVWDVVERGSPVKH